MCFENKGILSMVEKGCVIKLLEDCITACLGSSDNDRSGGVFMTIGDNEYRRQMGFKNFINVREVLNDKSCCI